MLNMFRYKYSFADVTFLVESEKEIQQEEKYAVFYTESESIDFSVVIRLTDALPEPTGELHSVSERRKTYSDGRHYMTYTYFFDMYEIKDMPYACRIDDSTLYILNKYGLRETAVFDALNLPELMLKKAVGIMHSSVVKYRNAAILFAGDKQVGKSTQAALWEKTADAVTVNGDRGALKKSESSIIVSGIPFCGTSGICHNEQLPVRAIICLSKGRTNKIRQLNGSEAYLSLLGKFAYNSYSVEESERVYELLSEIVETVPVYSYECLKDESAVLFLKEYLNL